MIHTKLEAFAAATDHLSLWEVAHRWTGHLPHDSDLHRIPSAVKDALLAMMRAQLASELRVANVRGAIFKDWTHLRLEGFIPAPEPLENGDDWHPELSEEGHLSEQLEKWDGSEEHRRELYFTYMHQKLKRHDEAIRDHAHILAGEKPIDRDYLESVHVSQEDLGRWALESSLPFPDFWFTPAQRQELETRYGNLAKINDLDAPGRLTETDVDRFWEQRLADKQRHRILCRAVAQVLWKENSEMTAREVVKHDVIQRYCGGKYYVGKDTIPDWIRDLDPRPVEKKSGPKKPK